MLLKIYLNLVTGLWGKWGTWYFESKKLRANSSVWNTFYVSESDWQGMARHIKAQSKVNKKWTPPPPLRRDRDPLWWPGEHSVSVGVEPVECNLHVVAELPGRHLRSGLSHQTDVYQQSHIKYWHWIIPWVPLSHQELVKSKLESESLSCNLSFLSLFFHKKMQFHIFLDCCTKFYWMRRVNIYL